MKAAIGLVVLALFSPYPVAMPTSHIRPTGIFSNMHWVEEAGDVYGLEVIIVGTRDGFVAMVQDAQGSPGKPVVVPVRAAGSVIEFDLPDPDGDRHFAGKISAEALTGSFTGSSEKLVLRRGKSYWQ